ncbi:NAD(P)H-dependent glycerol-3-phosphate dehydrogenase [Corynebacterium kroppenstedtii]|uniref:NAD(P)H-dependent glycerol-3-phosphate dehydrogenase n=1 Tax=Corynebacterium sp. PCR 32 TaxID=3351342 RepID=UPI0030A87D66
MVAVAVMGAGSWGTTMAKVFADAGNTVTLWARRTDVAEEIHCTRCNQRYLPGITLPDAITATSNPATALAGAEIVVLGVPSHAVRDSLHEWTPLIPTDALIVSLSKGLEQASARRMSDVIAEVTGRASDKIVVLSGPNLAKEIADEQPAATVIACTDHDSAKYVQDACRTTYFRPYTNTDVIGCEIGGVAKNVIALASGMAAGQKLGENTAATIITRGLAETVRLGSALGANPATFAGLAGLGDLVATCSSPLSRNRTFGERLSQGMSLKEAQEACHGQVAEGVNACRAIQSLARDHGVDVPIANAVVSVCFDNATVEESIMNLMERDTKPE